MKKNHSDKIANLKVDWNGYVDSFSFTAQGFNISGTLIVNRSTVNLKGKIPFAISLFRGKITKTIHEEAAKILS
jgi:hypothetical protein